LFIKDSGRNFEQCSSLKKRANAKTKKNKDEISTRSKIIIKNMFRSCCELHLAYFFLQGKPS
jgi:hypothetical protein